MGSEPAPHAAGICGDMTQLEGRYKKAQASFDTAQAAIRKKVGTSSKVEYLKLDRAVDLAWDQLQRAMRELSTHIREHGCGTIEEAPTPQNRFGETPAHQAIRKWCAENFRSTRRRFEPGD
jgi:hypothetical protein